VKNLMVSLAAGAAALLVSGASAAPLNPTATHIDNGVENVRMVCDESGRCWRERRQRRVIMQDDGYSNRNSYNSYNYDRGSRRSGYYEERPAVGIQVPGVSIGVGVGSGRW
jgi:hypothetical protein